MYLFILESIGTQELFLIGLVALIFLGPRKLPELARKIGKIMADLRNTSSEFRQTWEKEVDFEAEAKSLQIDSIESEVETAKTVSRELPPTGLEQNIAEPTIRDIDPEEFNARLRPADESAVDVATHDEPAPQNELSEGNEGSYENLSDKRTWL